MRKKVEKFELMQQALESLDKIIDYHNETAPDIYCLGEVVVDNEFARYFEKELSTIKQALEKAEEDKIIADFIRKHYKVSNNINGNFLELVKPYTDDECHKVSEVLE